MSRPTGTKLGAWRTANGYPRALEAARKAQCSRIHLLSIEGGAKNPSPELLARLGAVYGRSADQLKRAIRRTRLDTLARQTRATEKG